MLSASSGRTAIGLTAEAIALQMFGSVALWKTSPVGKNGSTGCTRLQVKFPGCALNRPSVQNPLTRELTEHPGVKHRDVYRVEGISTDIVLNLRYGKGLTSIRMDAVSNATATPVRARKDGPFLLG